MNFSLSYFLSLSFVFYKISAPSVKSVDESSIHFYEILYRAVIGSLKFCIKKTGRQFSALSVIVQAFAAFQFSATRLIGTVAE